MRKNLLFVAGMAAAMTTGLMVAPTVSVSTATEVRAAEQQAPQRVALEKPAPRIREQRSMGDAVRSMRIPTAHKNRSGGERANRRWRKRRASGRA